MPSVGFQTDPSETLSTDPQYTGRLFMPASGDRYGSTGASSEAGTFGLCWTGAVSGVWGGDLDLRSQRVHPGNADKRAFGFPVRCVQDLQTVF